MTDAATYFDTPQWSTEVLSHAIRLVLGSGTGCDAGDLGDDRAGPVAQRQLVQAQAAIAAAPVEVQALVFMLVGEGDACHADVLLELANRPLRGV